MAAIIKSHNKAILNETLAKPSATKSCNCRNSDQCPLDGNCLEKCLVYKAVVKTEKSTKSYIGCCETVFKTRYSNHKLSFSKKTYSTRTALSKHIWNLKENKLRIQNFLVRHSPSIPKFLQRKTLQSVLTRETTHQQVHERRFVKFKRRIAV